MSTKKARRKERRQQKQDQRAGQSGSARLFIFGIVAAIVLLVAAALVFGDRSGGPGAPPWPGAVWSADHGHWH